MTISKSRDALNYYWCLDHKQVEESVGCGSTTRIGPFATPAEASTALERTLKRKAEQEKRDAEDER